MIRTGVVVVTYNGAKRIRQCLGSVQSGTRHIVVVDNQSTDDTVVIVEAEFSGVEIIRMSTNAGFGIGNNGGISALLKRNLQYITYCCSIRMPMCCGTRLSVSRRRWKRSRGSVFHLRCISVLMKIPSTARHTWSALHKAATPREHWLRRVIADSENSQKSIQ
jgi:hypothetical protein